MFKNQKRIGSLVIAVFALAGALVIFVKARSQSVAGRLEPLEQRSKVSNTTASGNALPTWERSYAGTSAKPEQARTRERGPVRMIRFTLFEQGIFPGELKVDQGLINIMIEDKTNSTTGLVVERITGGERSRAGEIRRSPNHWRGREVLRLSPGRYQVFDASRPDNRAILLVER